MSAVGGRIESPFVKVAQNALKEIKAAQKEGVIPAHLKPNQSTYRLVKEAQSKEQKWVSTGDFQNAGLMLIDKKPTTDTFLTNPEKAIIKKAEKDGIIPKLQNYNQAILARIQDAGQDKRWVSTGDFPNAGMMLINKK